MEVRKQTAATFESNRFTAATVRDCWLLDDDPELALCSTTIPSLPAPRPGWINRFERHGGVLRLLLGLHPV